MITRSQYESLFKLLPAALQQESSRTKRSHCRATWCRKRGEEWEENGLQLEVEIARDKAEVFVDELTAITHGKGSVKKPLNHEEHEEHGGNATTVGRGDIPDALICGLPDISLPPRARSIPQFGLAKRNPTSLSTLKGTCTATSRHPRTEFATEPDLPYLFSRTNLLKTHEPIFLRKKLHFIRWLRCKSVELIRIRMRTGALRDGLKVLVGKHGASRATHC